MDFNYVVLLPDLLIDRPYRMLSKALEYPFVLCG